MRRKLRKILSREEKTHLSMGCYDIGETDVSCGNARYYSAAERLSDRRNRIDRSIDNEGTLQSRLVD